MKAGSYIFSPKAINLIALFSIGLVVLTLFIITSGILEFEKYIIYSKPQGIVFLKQNADDHSVNELQLKIKRIEDVAKVKYVNQTESKNEFLNDISANELTGSFIRDSIPAYIELTLNNLQNTEYISTEIKKSGIVRDVLFIEEFIFVSRNILLISKIIISTIIFLLSSLLILKIYILLRYLKNINSVSTYMPALKIGMILILAPPVFLLSIFIAVSIYLNFYNKYIITNFTISFIYYFIYVLICILLSNVLLKFSGKKKKYNSQIVSIID